ncbi:hypothetical protein MMC09_005577 [Bachmanniomyces sp. S44760]|nr:hypothetical protein [Bachmanniomyces sp. S44760]
MTPPTETTIWAPAPVKGTPVELPGAGTEPDAPATPDGAAAAALEAVVYGAEVVTTTAEVGAADVDSAAEVEADAEAEAEAEAAVVLAAAAEAGDEAFGEEEAAAEEEAGTAEATQAQTALADCCTAIPVTAPQPERTQFSAAALMAALLEGLHWQAKSVPPQPTPDAADWMHCV